MANATKKKTAVKKKPVKAKKTIAKKVTAKKVTAKKVTSRTAVKPAAKKKAAPVKGVTKKKKTSPAKSKAKPVRRKTKKYSPRSRYATFRIGDRLMFSQIKNWDGDGELEDVIGTVVRKIEDKKLDLKFLEVQFDLREMMPFLEDGIRTRRFVVR